MRQSLIQVGMSASQVNAITQTNSLTGTLKLKKKINVQIQNSVNQIKTQWKVSLIDYINKNK